VKKINIEIISIKFVIPELPPVRFQIALAEVPLPMAAVLQLAL
jgi:hypothetical protein